MARINSYEDDNTLSGDEKLLGTDPQDSSKTKNYSLNTLKTFFGGGGSSTYKVYSALLNQTGTANPTAVVMENTLSGSIVWTRDGVAGHYTGTLTGAFTNANIFYLTNNFGNASAPIGVEVLKIDNNSISLWTRAGASTSDGLLNGKTSIEIRVYN